MDGWVDGWMTFLAPRATAFAPQGPVNRSCKLAGMQDGRALCISSLWQGTGFDSWQCTIFRAWYCTPMCMFRADVNAQVGRSPCTRAAAGIWTIRCQE